MTVRHLTLLCNPFDTWVYILDSRKHALYMITSGGSRNLERGVQLRVHEAHPKIFGLPCPLPDVNAHVIIVTTGR